MDFNFFCTKKPYILIPFLHLFFQFLSLVILFMIAYTHAWDEESLMTESHHIATPFPQPFGSSGFGADVRAPTCFQANLGI